MTGYHYSVVFQGGKRIADPAPPAIPFNRVAGDAQTDEFNRLAAKLPNLDLPIVSDGAKPRLSPEDAADAFNRGVKLLPKVN